MNVAFNSTQDISQRLQWPTQNTTVLLSGSSSAKFTMCKCEFYRYDCGHETKAGYTHCGTGKPMVDSSEGCGIVNFEPVRKKSCRCDEKACKYVDALKDGWKCCKCAKGPNMKPRCEQDAASFFKDWKDCGHSFCEECSLSDKGKRKDTVGQGA